MNETQAVETLEKHISIDSAINRLESVTGQLKELRAKINGENIESLDSPKCEPPALVDLLNGSSDRIQNHINYSLELISDIEQILFR